MTGKSRKIKFFLLSVITIAIASCAAVFISRSVIESQNINLGLPVNPIKKGMAIDKYRQTAIRNGIKEWTLEAGSARLIGEKKQAVFQNIAVTFFLKDDDKVLLTARQGILNTESNDIEAAGDVVIKNEKYRLATDSLCYEHGRRRFYSRTPVALSSNEFNLKAESMSYDLNTNQTVLKGNVQGTLAENITL